MSIDQEYVSRLMLIYGNYGRPPLYTLTLEQAEALLAQNFTLDEIHLAMRAHQILESLRHDRVSPDVIATQGYTSEEIYLAEQFFHK
jgi:hypothetical protein